MLPALSGFALCVIISCASLQDFKSWINSDGKTAAAPKKEKPKSMTSRTLASTANTAAPVSNGSRRSPYDSIQDDRIGSLWNDQGQDNFYFSKNVRRRVGDLIILKTGQDVNDLVVAKLDSYFERLKAQTAKKKSGDAEAPAPASADEEIKIDLGDVSMKLDREVRNGTFEVVGQKPFFSRNQRFIADISGVVKLDDIGPDDTITSRRLLDSKVTLKK
jgi:flagellar basal body L-ring protein FlgH